MQRGCLATRRHHLPALAVTGVTVLASWMFGAAVPSATAASAPTGLGTSRVASTVSPATVWLCRPGMASNPCAYSRRATAIEADGSRSTATLSVEPPSTGEKFACFYVYPTVSTQKRANANLTVQTSEIAAAVAQASQFSQVCTVWAPMYRQATDSSIAKGLSRASGAALTLRSTFDVAYDSLLSAWRSFLAHDDHGRPIILLGHSQGAAILIHLIARQVDDDPALLRRLVVAIVAGGNLQVPTGKTEGATFTRVPLCTSPYQTGCAIAYSTFPAEPPSSAVLGRPGQGVSLQSGQTGRRGEQVACVNPSALGGGAGDLTPYFLSVTQGGLSPPVSTPWVTYPGLYSASCESKHGATWLQVTTIAGPSNSRPTVEENLGPTWGYHANDVNLVLGTLVRDVAGEEAAFVRSH